MFLCKTATARSVDRFLACLTHGLDVLAETFYGIACRRAEGQGSYSYEQRRFAQEYRFLFHRLIDCVLTGFTDGFDIFANTFHRVACGGCEADRGNSEGKHQFLDHGYILPEEPGDRAFKR